MLPKPAIENAKTEVRFVRTSDLELSISLRQVSNGSFAKAATQRVTRRATAAMGRERLTNVWCLNAMLQSGERLL